MRTQIIIVTLALILFGCKSHKEVVSDKYLTSDSVARSEHHRTIAVIDSAIRNIDFSFDTLKINIERPYSIGDSVACQPEIIRIKAIRGRVIDQRRVHRDSVEAFNRLDTVAYHQSAAETSTEHTATTRLYNPPDGSTMFIITILVIGCLLSVFYRKR
ncbi:MAG: hypothetical protein LIP02_07295 [Bacteroidales bacterium]|nr:hypothetical protein [Bacteroidales bacterium]